MLPISLTGLRVLDLSRLLPGPFCTLLLTRMGADVIKIETPIAGDYMRFAPPELGFKDMFKALNRGKRSIGLNFRNAKGKAILLSLVREADVIIEGFRPGIVDKWGIGYDVVRKLNPRIIYCSLSAYGQTGPYRNRSGHDLNFMALGGMLALNQKEGQVPEPLGIQVADMAGAMYAALAIASSLLERERSGKGSYLDIGLFDAVLAWGVPFLAGASRNALGGTLPCYNVYRTSDAKFVAIAALEPNLWSEFCEAIDRNDLLQRQFDQSAVQDVAHIIQDRREAEWLKIFAAHNFCAEPVLLPQQIHEHPQVVDRSPLKGLSELSYAPDLGEHTMEILKQAGLSESMIAELEAERVIRTSAAGWPTRRRSNNSGG